LVSVSLAFSGETFHSMQIKEENAVRLSGREIPP